MKSKKRCIIGIVGLATMLFSFITTANSPETPEQAWNNIQKTLKAIEKKKDDPRASETRQQGQVDINKLMAFLQEQKDPKVNEYIIKQAFLTMPSIKYLMICGVSMVMLDQSNISSADKATFYWKLFKEILNQKPVNKKLQDAKIQQLSQVFISWQQPCKNLDLVPNMIETYKSTDNKFAKKKLLKIIQFNASFYTMDEANATLKTHKKQLDAFSEFAKTTPAYTEMVEGNRKMAEELPNLEKAMKEAEKRMQREKNIVAEIRKLGIYKHIVVNRHRN